MVGYQLFRCSPWRWRQHGALKRWYPTTTLHGVTTQKTSTWFFTAMKVSNLSFLTPVLNVLLSFTFRLSYPWWRSRRYSLDRKFGGFQSRSELDGDRKFPALPQSQVVRPVTSNLYGLMYPSSCIHTTHKISESCILRKCSGSCERSISTHTHTHTHIYIYMYIYYRIRETSSERVRLI
jgi:hypothetical protein